MFRFLFLLIVLAGIAGYFTRPDEAAHREAMRETLRTLQSEALSNLDLGGALETSMARLSEDGRYTDYYVASHYEAEAGGRVLAECWGAFAQVRCMPKVGANAAAG